MLHAGVEINSQRDRHDHIQQVEPLHLPGADRSHRISGDQEEGEAKSNELEQGLAKEEAREDQLEHGEDLLKDKVVALIGPIFANRALIFMPQQQRKRAKHNAEASSVRQKVRRRCCFKF